MITIKVNGTNFEFFDSYDIALRFDTIASTFSFNAVFDSQNALHRSLFKPLSYSSVEIYWNGGLILSGVMINASFSDSSTYESVKISGYSKTGILEDCAIAQESYPLDFEKLTLLEIATKLCSPFGISVVTDLSSEDLSIANMEIKSDSAKETETVKSYLSSLCNQRNLILTHNEQGQLLITKVKASTNPVQHFSDKVNPATKMVLAVNGQAMFSEILVMKQASVDTENAGQATVNNPLVSVKRTTTEIQSSGTDNDTEKVANNLLSKQLKNIKLNINCDRNTFNNGSLFKPNKVITVQNDEIYLFNRAYFFIESVTLKGSNKENVANLSCVLPEVYTKEKPTNIFA